jgi:hypothetical protein
MEPSALDDHARAEILEFYGDVFGWTEGDNRGEDGNPLILYTGEFGQFVYLLPGTPALTAPALDHFGVLVDTLDELHAIAERVRAWRDRDERVRVIEVHTRTTHGATTDYVLTSLYLGFLLPLLIEVQHLEARPHSS